MTSVPSVVGGGGFMTPPQGWFDIQLCPYVVKRGGVGSRGERGRRQGTGCQVGDELLLATPAGVPTPGTNQARLLHWTTENKIIILLSKRNSSRQGLTSFSPFECWPASD